MDVPDATTKYKRHPVGWLSPQGDYYPCATSAQHYELAYALLNRLHPCVAKRVQDSFRAREDDALQERGWIRVGAMMSYNFGFIIWRKPTQKQVDVIWDYCAATKNKMPDLEYGWKEQTA